MCDDTEPQPLDEQLEFILRAGDSDALLVAGPGTGKTFTLEHTARHLVEERGVDADRLRLVTLTRSMAGSLEERTPFGAASTLHSFALHHLNRLGEARDRRVADAWERENLVEEDLHLGVKEEFDVHATPSQAADYLDELARSFRENQQEPADLSPQNARFHRVFRRQRELFRYRLLDELVPDLLEILEQGGELEDPPDYLLVDEYQDLNPAELRLLRQIARGHDTRVVACGDDRQSIYGFREADHLALHRFPQVYGLDEVDYLWRSWRCPRVVCQLAEEVARPLPALENIERPPLHPAEDGEEGDLVVGTVRSVPAEASWVLEECARLVSEEGYRPHEIMIIAASFRDAVERELHDQSEEMEGVPFEVYDPEELDPMGNQPAVRTIGAALRLADEPNDQVALRTLQWATPRIGETRRREILTGGHQLYRENLEAVADRIAACRPPVDTAAEVVDRFGDGGELDAREVMEVVGEGLGRDFEEQTGLQRLYENVDAPAAPGDWLEEIRGLQQKDLIEPGDRPEGIPVRTIFGAKGREASVVFLMNAIEYSFSGHGDIADGIRKLYVALSRASDRLYVTAPHFVGYTQIGNAIDADYAGLYDHISQAARRLGFEVRTLE